MPKNFKTNGQQTDRVNRLIDRYKAKNPNATDVDALMAFGSAWDLEDAVVALPGSADQLRSFDMHMSAARDEMAAVVRVVTTERQAARQEVAEELSAKESRIETLEAALAAAQDEVAELRVAKEELEAANARLAERNARLVESVEANDEVAKLREVLGKYMDAHDIERPAVDSGLDERS